MTEPFHFPDGRVANNAQDLLELCEQYPDDATGFLVRQDLEKWLAYIGDYDVAECAANARQIDVSDRQKLEDFLNKCHSLTEPQLVPSAETETNLKDNLTAPESASTMAESPQEIADATVAQSEALEAAETSLAEAIPPQKQISEKSATKTSVDSNATNSEKKPSFFQVVAKFIVNILYRNKA
jgi:ATP phosphoribosyltransferase regulatory subunit HisZ